MCGIAGIILEDDARLADPALLDRMAGAMVHRGPDAQGILNAPGAGFAFRRLAIIDREGSDQPIGNENGRVAIIFNGEIYNYRELRRELIQRGHRFRTEGDAETILHGYEEWGPRGVCERLRGMFAFAIHDRDEQRVVLARDRLGIKPLFVMRLERGWAFGSELKPLLAAAPTRPSVCPRALIDFATLGYVPAPRAIFRGVEKVRPGEVVVFEAGRETSRERYFRPRFRSDPWDLDEAADAVLERVREAVRIRLMSEVPLGCFLSGGIDSSAIAAAMVEEAGTSIDAICVGFDDPTCDERDAAARVAAHLGIRPQFEVAKVEPSALDGVERAFCEPHADPSCVPTWLLSQATKRRVTVALSGDGGDELFGGYRRYAFDVIENRMRALLPRAVREAVLAPLGAMWPKADFLPRPLRAKTLLSNLAREPVEGYLRSVSRILPEEVERLLDPDALAGADGYRTIDHFRAIDDVHRLEDPLLRIRAIDLETWLPDDILAKVDRASMAHSLEVRVPLLDHHLVELAATLPAPLLIRGGERKRVFKHALRRLLPDDVLGRKKHGFDMPVDRWLRGPLAPELDLLVEDSHGPLEGFFDRGRARELLREHRSGRRDRKSELWTLVAFGRWARRYGGAT